jgi:hypothetical protein
LSFPGKSDYQAEWNRELTLWRVVELQRRTTSELNHIHADELRETSASGSDMSRQLALPPASLQHDLFEITAKICRIDSSSSLLIVNRKVDVAWQQRGLKRSPSSQSKPLDGRATNEGRNGV